MHSLSRSPRHTTALQINDFKDDVARAHDSAHALHGGHLTPAEQDEIISMLVDIKEQKK